MVEQAGGGVGGAVAGSAAGAFAGKLGASLLGKLKKKDKPAEAPQAQPAAAAANPGMIRLFRVETETVSIKSDPIPGSSFDLPAGYNKVGSP